MFAEIIYINGIVQGVGFRPFIYNLAIKFSLNGWILNSSNGVEIHIEGGLDNINEFKKEIIRSAPILALINSFTSSETPFLNCSGFTIKESTSLAYSNIFISPDIATCKECEEDILNISNKRYYYPFTNCTNCGPRFSIIKDMPYDRNTTTMTKFPICSTCKDEYDTKSNRRFHAQPNCCSSCGPQLQLIDKNGLDITTITTSNINSKDHRYNKLILDFFIKKILLGKIFALKSLSGFHLCCDAFNVSAIKKLRARKIRPTKPFAIMMKSVTEVKKYCYVSDNEEKLLESSSRPIVLLRHKMNSSLPNEISPNNNYIGIMLPSTPIHILLFSYSSLKGLVMTSGNLSSLPLEYDNNSAIKNLSKYVDYFLLHNRDIYIPMDDSICKIVNSKTSILRRGRGFSPTPHYFPGHNNILALGSNTKNTFSFSKNDYIFTSAHCGDLINYESISRYKDNIFHFLNIFKFEPNYIASDLHQDYESTKISSNFDLPVIKVQHHHAHIASCMVDNNYFEKVIGVSFDGTGLGDDNCIWGSEFLICNFQDYKRVGHLEYCDFIGGDKSLKDGYKIALSYISSVFNSYDDKNRLTDYLNSIYKVDWSNILILIGNKINTYKSSSMGRLFDGVSSLLNLCHRSTFEGEGAIILESLIKDYSYSSNSYGINITEENETYLFSVINLITQILDDILMDTPPEIISHKFHSTIVNYILTMCSCIRDKYNINTVALSGGVFQNNFILNNSIRELEAMNFNVLTHKNFPTNDGGISIGQLVIAKYKI